jgi:hypothetical protein
MDPNAVLGNIQARMARQELAFEQLTSSLRALDSLKNEVVALRATINPPSFTSRDFRDFIHEPEIDDGDLFEDSKSQDSAFRRNLLKLRALLPRHPSRGSRRRGLHGGHISSGQTCGASLRPATLAAQLKFSLL